MNAPVNNKSPHGETETRKKPAQQRTKHGKAAAKEVPASRHIPYLRHVDSNTIETLDGLLVKVIKLEGFAHETADQGEINRLQEKRNAMLMGLNDNRYAIWSTLVHRKEVNFPDGDFPSGFSKELNRQYQDKMLQKQLFENDLYVTVVRKGAGDKLNKFVDFLKALGQKMDIEAQQEADREVLRELDEVSDKILSNLAPYEPTLLGIKETSDGLASEPLSFFSFLVNGVHRDVLLPRMALNHYIGNVRPFFAKDAFELKGLRQSKIGGAVTIKEYPGITKPSIFNELLKAPYEFVLTQSFTYMDRNTALGEMKTQKRQLESAGDDAVSLVEELSFAMDDLASGKISYGYHHFTMMCFGDTTKQLQKNLADADSRLADRNINAVREDIALEASFWAQLPGNMSYIGRKAAISSQNYAAFASYHNYPCGRIADNHWGAAITLLESVSGSPYYFNFHKNDLGNSTVIGPSGSGKTVLMTFLQAQMEKFKPRRVYLDKDRGAEIFIRAIGGHYAQIEPGVKTGFNPFQLEHTPRNEAFLNSLVSLMVSEKGKPLSAVDTESVTKLVRGNFKLDLKDRYIENLMPYLPQGSDNHLALRFKRWFGNGDLAWLFDNKVDQFPKEVRTIGYDLTHILDEPIARAAALRYMFHNIEGMIDGTPITITMDEGWKGLEDKYVGDTWFDWEKTIRKRNGILCFGSQSARDVSETRIGTTIIEQSPTQIFYANPDADYEAYCNAFSLTDREFDLIKNHLDPDDRHFIIKHGKNSVVARLDLRGMDDALAVLSGREATVRLLDEIRTETGDDPKAWLPIFHERRKTL